MKKISVESLIETSRERPKFFNIYCCIIFILVAVLIAVGTVFLTLAFRGDGDSTPDTYRAAVVEYNVERFDSVTQEVNKALADYVQMIKEAKKNGAQIIVFPELTLNPREPIKVPDENEKAQPWSEPYKYSKVLYDLSKTAHEQKIYVVANVIEKALNETTETGEDEYIIFNTNVVFDTNGRVISRYRKINLHGEPGRTASLDKKMGVFTTNFGVKFGHFISFDLIFQQPAVQILKKEKISNVIFPAMWFSSLPFLTAVQIQESWAFVHNVNLLASGASQPMFGSTGSGIYSGKRGRLTAVMHGVPQSKILCANVPKDPNQDYTIRADKPKKISNKNNISKVASYSMHNLHLIKSNLTFYKSVILDKTGVFAVTHGKVHCSVNIKFLPEEETDQSKYVYRLVTYDGVRLFSVVTAGISDCGVVACLNDDINSCATRFKNSSDVWPINTISSIELHAIVPKPEWNEDMQVEDTVYHPVTLDKSVMPLPVDDYDYTVIPSKKGFQEIVMKVDQVELNYDILLTFGITGRAFERDGLPVQH